MTIKIFITAKHYFAGSMLLMTIAIGLSSQLYGMEQLVGQPHETANGADYTSKEQAERKEWLQTAKILKDKAFELEASLKRELENASKEEMIGVEKGVGYLSVLKSACEAYCRLVHLSVENDKLSQELTAEKTKSLEEQTKLLHKQAGLLQDKLELKKQIKDIQEELAQSKRRSLEYREQLAERDARNATLKKELDKADQDLVVSQSNVESYKEGSHKLEKDLLVARMSRLGGFKYS